MKVRRARKKESSEAGSLLRLVLTFAVAAWVIRSFLFTPFSIPSGSMLPTLRIGDYLFVAKWPYGFSRNSFPWKFPPFDGRIFSHLPKRGDVVVFVPPGRESEDYVKRVIGLPGDVIAVRNGAVILNGRALPRDQMRAIAIPISANSPCRVVPPARPKIAASGGQRACLYPSYRETLPNGASYRIIDQVRYGMADNFERIVVPPNHVFLMGDNRDDSLDSRFSVAEGGIGLVPMENLVGRATILFWSTDGSASYLKPWTWFTALRADRVGTSLASGAR
jgi:signal peptidase I